MYYLEIISLEGCPYSEAAEKLVENNKINNKVFKISYNNRENHKNEKISTFPQIYLKKNNSNGRILIGGYDKINEIHSLIKNRKLIKSEEKSVYNSSYDLLVDKISKMFSPNDNFNKKSVLRLIQLLL
jgi:glutaredoxin